MSRLAGATVGGKQRNLIIGSLIALLTVTIWAVWLVGTRYAVRGALLPHDIALMRFIVPAVVILMVRYEIDADASEEDIAALVAQSQKRSAVFDIITNPTNVHVEVNS